MLDQLRSADFRSLLHENFELLAPQTGQYTAETTSVARQLELIEVEDLGATNVVDPTRRYPFSIIFREAARTYVPQSIYTLTHPKLGQLDLFLVPIGPDLHGMRYQAVFN